MAKDPVCGVEVDENRLSSRAHTGKTYYFCAIGCKEGRKQTRINT